MRISKKLRLGFLITTASLILSAASTVLADLQDDLCTAAKDYYQARSESGYRPPEASCTDNGNGTYIIHLYEIVDDGNGFSHSSTYAWYEVDSNGTGKDTILGKPVQLVLPGQASGAGIPNIQSMGNMTSPFYGIWCEADKDINEARNCALSWRNMGFPSAQVFLTSEWSNLNPEPWYAVSAGIYSSENDAWYRLSQVQSIYPDAYIKYSGEYLKTGSPSFNPGSVSTVEHAAVTSSHSPFYGIWCEADRDYNEAEKMAQKWRNSGFPSAQVFLTSNWNNLNSDPWYAVSAGVYHSWESAESALYQVQSFYPDAYIKYSGEYK